MARKPIDKELQKNIGRNWLFGEGQQQEGVNLRTTQRYIAHFKKIMPRCGFSQCCSDKYTVLVRCQHFGKNVVQLWLAIKDMDKGKPPHWEVSGPVALAYPFDGTAVFVDPLSAIEEYLRRVRLCENPEVLTVVDSVQLAWWLCECDDAIE